MRTAICNIPVDVLTMCQTLDQIEAAILRRKQIHHVVINAAKVVKAQKDTELRNAITSCDIINADGQSIVWASRILGQPLPERVAGIDLMAGLVELSARKGYRIFFLGAKEEVVRKVVDRYSREYSPDLIAGYRNGYFTKEEEWGIAEMIAAAGADILFVAITSPKKEIFLNTYKHLIKTPFIMGVGGSFDVVSGMIRRAPLWMQKSGLEWLFRVMQEPRRMWKRYLVTNTRFIAMIIQHKFRKI